jgi:hypothetical protein
MLEVDKIVPFLVNPSPNLITRIALGCVKPFTSFADVMCDDLHHTHRIYVRKKLKELHPQQRALCW